MITRVDWISFTVPMLASGTTDQGAVLQEVKQALAALDAGMLEALALFGFPAPGKGRAPYKQRWQFDDDGVAVYTHANLNHATIEISGRTCARLHRDELIHPILSLVRDRCTRLDIATDILTETTPTTFAGDRASSRFKSEGFQRSNDGETVYIGSMKSDRYCRVYRYNPPHDRSHLLRVEFVIRKKQAPLTIDAILADGEQAVALSLGRASKFIHPDWDVDATTPAEIAVWRPERRKGSTVFWLNDTIAPLIARLHNEGTIDVYEYLTEHVIPRIITSADE